MALGGSRPQRGTAAASASMRRRKTASCGASGGASGGSVETVLQFYTHDSSWLKLGPKFVVIMSICFIAFVTILHVLANFH
ncbi:hypothetical protein K2173_013399 [Erythroxylum novogranatense]|uniref:Protein transport protein Sec61 subunit beta n=1 Tax=Erythroxylum novogranatense TaxID=1862640 RepID=A0AAV8S9R3_9ROSI|nr:hypothetical protein K2173_013399 [Erythroxylum novogranatense]